MAINVGALELTIAIAGARAAEAELSKLDAAARKAGASASTLEAALRPSGATLRQLTTSAAGNEAALSKMSRRLREVAEGLQFARTRADSLSAITALEGKVAAAIKGGNTTLYERIQLEKQLQTAQAARSKGSLLGTVGGALSSTAGKVLGGLGVAVGVGAAVSGFTSLVGDAVQASFKFQASLRALDAIAKQTGVPLVFLKTTADGLQKSLGLTATQANTMTATAVRFTAAAGKAGQTGEFLTNWLNLAAGRGLDAEEAMSALNSTFGLQEEGLRKLGLSTPGAIARLRGLKEGASDAAKLGAIVAEVHDKAATQTGKWAEVMGTAQGEVIRLDNAKQDFLVTLGNAITKGENFKTAGDALVGMFKSMEGWVKTNSDGIGQFVRGIGDAIQGTLDLYNKLHRLFELTPSGWLQRFMTTGWGARNTDAARAAADPMSGVDTGFSGGMGSMFSRPSSGTTPPKETDAERKAREKAAKEAREQEVFAAEDALRGGPGFVGAQSFGTDALGAIANRPIGAARTKEKTNAEKADEERRKELWNKLQAEKQRFTALSHSIGMSISTSIGAGIKAGLRGGIGAGFKALGASLIGGLGSAVKQFGEQALAAALVMDGLLKSFMNLLPGGAVLKAIEMIAIGSLMEAAAGSFGGGGGGGGGSSGRVAAKRAAEGGPTTEHVTLGQRSAPTRSAPTTAPPMQPFVFAPTIIGPADPKAQRALVTMMQGAHERGFARG